MEFRAKSALHACSVETRNQYHSVNTGCLLTMLCSGRGMATGGIPMSEASALHISGQPALAQAISAAVCSAVPSNPVLWKVLGKKMRCFDSLMPETEEGTD